MEGSHRLNIEQMSSFLVASSELEMAVASRDEARQIVTQVLSAQQYWSLRKKAKGIVRQYLMRTTGYGRAHHPLDRRIPATRRTRIETTGRRRFPTRYTNRDIELLAAMDSAHLGLSGPAVGRLLYRAWAVYGDSEYQRLAGISVSHIYNLRAREAYRKYRAVYRATQSSPVAIAERRCPDPKGSPGWLRVDTVHQGDPRNGQAGLYHINAVDTVTQWQVVGCAETISERHLLALRRCYTSFRFASVAFIPTTAASSSTTK